MVWIIYRLGANSHGIWYRPSVTLRVFDVCSYVRSYVQTAAQVIYLSIYKPVKRRDPFVAGWNFLESVAVA